MNLLREKLRAQGHHLAQLGGGSSSSSAQTTNQTDNRRVIGQNGVSAENSNVTYTVTDDGAISGGLDLASKSLGAMLNLSTTTANNSASLDKSILGFAAGTQSAALDSLSTNTAAIQNAYASARGQGNLTEYILIGCLAIAGIIAYTALKK